MFRLWYQTMSSAWRRQFRFVWLTEKGSVSFVHAMYCTTSINLCQPTENKDKLYHRRQIRICAWLWFISGTTTIYDRQTSNTQCIPEWMRATKSNLTLESRTTTTNRGNSLLFDQYEYAEVFHPACRRSIYSKSMVIQYIRYKSGSVGSTGPLAPQGRTHQLTLLNMTDEPRTLYKGIRIRKPHETHPIMVSHQWKKWH